MFSPKESPSSTLSISVKNSMVSIQCFQDVVNRRSRSEICIPSFNELVITTMDKNCVPKLQKIFSPTDETKPVHLLAPSMSLQTNSTDAPLNSSRSSITSLESFCSMSSMADVQATKTRKSKPAPWKKQVQQIVEPVVEDRSDFTTVLLRNIPTRYVTSWLIEEIQATGNRCNFVHMPMAKKFDINLGYAFINFVTPAEALDFYENFQGHQFVKQPRSAKRATVEFSSLQGFEENVDFYSARRVAKSKHAPWILREN